MSDATPPTNPAATTPPPAPPAKKQGPPGPAVSGRTVVVAVLVFLGVMGTVFFFLGRELKSRQSESYAMFSRRFDDAFNVLMKRREETADLGRWNRAVDSTRMAYAQVCLSSKRPVSPEYVGRLCEKLATLGKQQVVRGDELLATWDDLAEVNEYGRNYVRKYKGRLADLLAGGDKPAVVGPTTDSTKPTPIDRY
ncbi:MAG: hypothetical protein ACRC1K_11175 [Planctomycetia bacterium]